MRKNDKKRADRFLQNRGKDDFCREEYRRIEENLFGAPEAKTRNKSPGTLFHFPRFRVRSFAFAGSLATVIVVAFSSFILYTGQTEGPARFAERGGPVFETYAIHETGDGEPSIRSLQGIEIVSIDELLQFRAPAQPDCTRAAIFGVDDSFDLHYYFPQQPDDSVFMLQKRADTFSPGSIRLASDHRPGYLRIFFACIDDQSDFETIIEEIERIKADTDGDFNALAGLTAEGIELTSQLIKIKEISKN
jgi:hypothetical protein